MVRIASSNSRQKRRKRLLVIVGIIFAILIVLFLLSLWFVNTSWLRIMNVTVSGQNVIPEASIQAVVTDDIAGRYAGLFSKANIFFYPKHKIETDLRVLYPTLGNADVHAVDFHTVAISVNERTPYALWCANDAAAASNGTDLSAGGCVLLDESGLAYAHAPEYSGHVYETYIGALADGPLPKQFLTPASFHSLSALVDTFSKKIATNTITTVTIDEHKDVHLATAEGYSILFALDDDSGDVFQHFSLILGAAPFTTHKLSDFQYVDLRFGDKVYYKLKN